MESTSASEQAVSKDSNSSTLKTFDSENEYLAELNGQISEPDFQNQIMTPEILELIWLNVNDLMSIHDYANTCKDYRREYAGWFFEFMRSLYPQFLIEVIQSYDSELCRFKEPWNERNPEEIMAFLCKVVLSLPNGIDSKKVLPQDDREAWRTFISAAGKLFDHMSKNHKFDNVQQYTMVFKSLSKAKIYYNPLPNVHFTKQEAFETIIDCYEWKFGLPQSIDMIVDLILEAFSDKKEIVDQLSNITAATPEAQRAFLLKLAKWENIESITESRDEWVDASTFISDSLQSVDHLGEASNILPIFAQTMISEIVHSIWVFPVPAEMLYHITERIARKKLTEMEKYLVFEFLGKCGYDTDILKLTVESFSSNQ